MKWHFVLGAFFLSYGLAIAAYVWRPPEMAYLEMVRAASAVPTWHLRLSGKIGELPLKGDLVKRASGEVLARLSYRPLKLLNNQWIQLADGLAIAADKNSAGEWFSIFALDQRLSTSRIGGTRFWRYAFRPSPAVTALIPALAEGQGEVWFKRHTKMPSFIQLALGPPGSPALLNLQLEYRDPLENDAPQHVRALPDVLEQLGAVQEAHQAQPETLIPLRARRNNEQAWQSDFDRDGVNDALEVFYGIDAANPDTDNDTFLDGEEIDQGYNPAGEGDLK